jgi:hypothetical protein
MILVLLLRRRLLLLMVMMILMLMIILVVDHKSILYIEPHKNSPPIQLGVMHIFNGSDSISCKLVLDDTKEKGS